MTKQLFSTSGKGVKGHHRPVGHFEVRVAGSVKSFTVLEEAYDHFQSLNEESTLWDVTGIPELLESKQYN
jgi:hypothetical protein